MDANAIQALLTTAIAQATEQTRATFQSTINNLTQRLQLLELPAEVQEYKEIEILENVVCNESLDVVKSVPEFNGDSARYISWRQSAVTAHKLYEKRIGSSKCY